MALYLYDNGLKKQQRITFTAAFSVGIAISLARAWLRLFFDGLTSGSIVSDLKLSIKSFIEFPMTIPLAIAVEYSESLQISGIK